MVKASKFDPSLSLLEEKDLPTKEKGSGELILEITKSGVTETRKKARYKGEGSKEVID